MYMITSLSYAFTSHQYRGNILALMDLYTLYMRVLLFPVALFQDDYYRTQDFTPIPPNHCGEF